MAERTTRTQQLINYFDAGMINKALAILTTFRHGLTTEEKETVRIAHECNTGKESFYQALKIDTAQRRKMAVEILTTYVSNSRK